MSRQNDATHCTMCQAPRPKESMLQSYDQDGDYLTIKDSAFDTDLFVYQGAKSITHSQQTTFEDGARDTTASLLEETTVFDQTRGKQRRPYLKKTFHRDVSEYETDRESVSGRSDVAQQDNGHPWYHYLYFITIVPVTLDLALSFVFCCCRENLQWGRDLGFFGGHRRDAETDWMAGRHRDKEEYSYTPQQYKAME